MSPSLLDQAIIARSAAYVPQHGERAPTYTDVAHAASVQPMRPARTVEYGLEAGVAAFAVYTATDPELKTGDTVLWRGRALEVLAPAQDQAGKGMVWMTPCREVS